MTYYVIGEGNNFYEGMTKEQILAAITQAIETHTITDVDTGFVTKLKEKNKNNQLSVWVGTEAEFNAIEEKDQNTLYIKTDDSTLEAIGEQFELYNQRLTNCEKVFNKISVSYTKDNLPTGVMDSTTLSKLSTLSVKAVKSGNIVQVFFACMAGNEAVMPIIDDLAKLFYSGTPTNEQRQSVMPIVPVFSPAYKRLSVEIPTYQTDGVIGTAYINDFANAIDFGGSALGIKVDFALTANERCLYSMCYQTEF